MRSKSIGSGEVSFDSPLDALGIKGPDIRK